MTVGHRAIENSTTPADKEAIGIIADAAVDKVIVTFGAARGKHSSALLNDIPPERQLNLRFERISAFVNTDYEQPGVFTRLRRAVDKQEREAARTSTQKQILHDITGEMRPGEMLALMGPSGSGKTSLLSIISGRAARAVQTRGRVTSNGEKLTKAAKRRVGFVLQDDLLYESLTVWETLSYAAALRLPRNTAPAQRAERVEAVLAALGLLKCRDTIIGGFFMRGISGGERKRVSIGHELLINPAMLMLDEPTSGLDSTTALHLLVTLRQLALGGRAIATTIHQPSSRLYQQLDRLMLLAEGHVVYYGAANQVITWFSMLGFQMPYGVNVADFLLDLAQGEVEGGDLSRLAITAGSSTEQMGEQQQQQQSASELQHLPHVLHSGETAPGMPASRLSGPAAIRALYSSYKTFKQKHKEGFDASAQQLKDLQLALDPPLTRRQKAAAVEAAAAGTDPAAGLHKRLGGNSATSSNSLFGRGLHKAGSFLGLTDAQGAANQQGKGINSTADPHGDSSDMFSDDSESDDEYGSKEAGFSKRISRIWSQSASMLTIMGNGAAAGDASGAGCLDITVQKLGVVDRGGANYSTQWQVLLKRSIKVKRFESLSSQRFLQGVVVAVITGLFWWQRGRGNSLLAASDIVGLLFFELLFPAFTAMFTALFTFPNDYRMLLKERASGMYRVSAFYLASACSDLPMDCAYPVMFVIIIYFMGGLRLTAGAFLANVACLVLNVLVAQSLGLYLGVAFMNPKTAQTVASIIMLGFMLVGGYYVRGIPDWISWMRYLSFVYWGFNLFLKIEFAGATYYVCGPTAGQDPAAAAAAGVLHAAAADGPCTAIPDLQQALQLPTDPNSSPALDVGIMFAMLVVLRLLVYQTLRQKTKAV